MKINLRNDERALFIGKTGSGKTELAKHFLRTINRIVVIDPKHTFRMDEFVIRRRLPVMGSQYKIIFRPRDDDDEFMFAFLRDLMRQKNVTIYCDEVATLAEMFPLSTRYLANLARTGRERRVSVWTATQRPRWVPRVFFTEAEAIFMFNVRDKDDRSYMAQFIGQEANEPIEKYQFWYSHADEENPALMRLDLGKNYIVKIG